MRFLTKLVLSLCMVCFLTTVYSSILWKWFIARRTPSDDLHIRGLLSDESILESPMHKYHSIILMWRHPWGSKSEGIRNGTVIGKCTFTYDRTQLRNALAVVFHYTAFDDVGRIRWTYPRHPDQIYVWYSLQSPWHLKNVEHRSFNEFYGDFINWTMTYRTDSDIFYPYVQSALLKESANGRKGIVDIIISKKKRVALWVVSNCHRTKATLDRFKFVDELMSAGLPVDRFGACFNNSQEYNELLKDVQKRSSYKFYLYLENAHNCRDYITEKFWNSALMSGRVPVVWKTSKEDLQTLAPPGSYIHAEDFGSPANLVAYLLYLDKNLAAYRSYFKWREESNHSPASSFLNLYNLTREEQLCKKARANKEHKSIFNIRKYLFENEREECLLK